MMLLHCRWEVGVEQSSRRSGWILSKTRKRRGHWESERKKMENKTKKKKNGERERGLGFRNKVNVVSFHVMGRMRQRSDWCGVIGGTPCWPCRAAVLHVASRHTRSGCFTAFRSIATLQSNSFSQNPFRFYCNLKFTMLALEWPTLVS